MWVMKKGGNCFYEFWNLVKKNEMIRKFDVDGLLVCIGN